MKKIKELLIFLALLVAPIIINFVIISLANNVDLVGTRFAGIVNYIRMFSNDKIFWRALLNTFLNPAILGLLVAAIFAVIVFLVRKKLKSPRRVFYFGSFIIGVVTTLFYNAYLSLVFSYMFSDRFTSKSVISQILEYKPSILEAINLPNIIYSIYIGISIIFIFWIFELVGNILKKHYKKISDKVKRILYYLIPFVAVPILMLLCVVLHNTYVVQMNPYIISAVLLLFSVAMGFFSTTNKTFDYLLTVIMPISLFCYLFVGGVLPLSDLESRFYLYKAVKGAFQPIALQLYFLMAITTFLASFKRFRNIKKSFKN